MNETNKDIIIRHSLLFSIIIDALPYMQYDSTRFKSDEPWYIEHITAKLNEVDIEINDFALQKTREQE